LSLRLTSFPGGMRGRSELNTMRCEILNLAILSRKYSTSSRLKSWLPVPVLDGGRLVRRSHVQVGQDERVGVDRPGVGQLGDRQGPLVRVQGAAAP